MGNNITELVFITDMSGSMADMRADTVGGINTVLRDQKKLDGKVLVTTVVFNSVSRTVHDRLPLEDVPDMTLDDYVPSGCTALLDALGSTIRHIAGIHKYARKEDVPEHTLFVITTDGMVNASHSYTAAKVKEMVEHEKEKYGWEFIYLAANIDAVETAGFYGIDSSRAVNYHNDALGSAMVYDTVCKAARAVRCDAPLERSAWRDSADADYKHRKKH